jgi:hypothetical protein
MAAAMRWPRYLWRALNARPFGMPVPPLWFGIAAAGLAGYFLAPAFVLMGGAAVLLFTGLVASNRRFQQVVDAGDVAPAPDERSLMLERLDEPGHARQMLLEQQCAELQRVLETAKAGAEHIEGVWQLAHLHLRLLAARSAAAAVLGDDARAGSKALAAQIDKLKGRQAQPDIDNDLREALGDQREVIEKRLAMQNEAHRRLQLLDTELDRIREQVALIREQALLTSDPGGIRRSVDSLATFLNESGRWLQEQEEIFGGLDTITSDPFGPSEGISQPRQRSNRRTGESQ